MMISLGEGKFVISHGTRIGVSTKQFNDIVSVDKFEGIMDGKFHNANIISGSVNLQHVW
ncbi:MAG TPA: hypothetical protein ACHBX0_03085 [Arsenophonus sp.]